MRFDGTLSKWNDDRGFGFITPRQGGREVFVHISAFPRDGQRPHLHESLSYEIELNNEGKKRAVSVRQASASLQPHARRKVSRSRRRSGSLLGTTLTVVMLCVIGTFGYTKYSRLSVTEVPGSAAQQLDATSAQQYQVPAVTFSCDGRTYCSQMSSCAEAKFFLSNCPGVKMDGDDDGVPCERQWCTSMLAN